MAEEAPSDDGYVLLSIRPVTWPNIIEYFPAAVVSRIFSFAAGDADYILPLILSQVSRKWRWMALTTPTVWSSIFVWNWETLANSKIWLERAEGVPVSLTLCLPPRSAETEELYQAILGVAYSVAESYAAGIRRLAIRMAGSTSDYVKLSEQIRNAKVFSQVRITDFAHSDMIMAQDDWHFQLVRYLYRRYEDVNDHRTSVDCFTDVNKFHNFRFPRTLGTISSFTLCLNSTISPPQPRRMHGCTELLQMIFFSPRVDVLAWGLRSLAAVNLKHLQIGVSDELVIPDDSDTRSRTSERYEDMSEVLWLLIRFSSLEELILSNGSFLPSVLTLLFTEMPKLKLLSFEKCGLEDDFFEKLRWPTPQGQLLCPELSSLRVISCHKITWEAVMHCLESRWADHNLHYLEVRDCRGIPVEDTDQFEEHVDVLVTDNYDWTYHKMVIPACKAKFPSMSADEHQLFRRIYGCEFIPEA